MSECFHIWNAHGQCQWCKASKRLTCARAALSHVLAWLDMDCPVSNAAIDELRAVVEIGLEESP